MDVIDRSSYLDALIRRKGNGLVKIVTGIRRCGKSYLLFELFRNHLICSGVKEDHIIAVSLEGYDNRNLREPGKLLDHIRERIVDDDVHYVLLDEIQLVKDFTEILNTLVKAKNLDVYVTGSNSKFLSKDVVTEFRGRGDEVRLHPLSFAEFLSSRKGDKEEALDEYLEYGGLPLILTYPTPEDKMDHLHRQFEAIYLKDIVERHRLKGEENLNEVLNILASSIGSLVSPFGISRELKTRRATDKTVGKAIECLEDAFIVSEVKRQKLGDGRIVGSPFKVYFEDLGLRNARSSFDTNSEGLLENSVYNELRTRGFDVVSGEIERVGRGVDGKSSRSRYGVDFVATKGRDKYYIQVAHSLDSAEKIEQEKRPFSMIDDSFKKLIVTRYGTIRKRDEKGIITLGLADFLLDKDLLRD